MVGAIVVRDGFIIGEGWHHHPGGPHAEVNALRNAGLWETISEQQDFVSDTTLYVNLEPCCHYGKTPPCTDLIIKTGISRVVVGATDPSDKVNGGGIQRLRDAGIEVIVGVLEDDCRRLNKVFYCNHEKHRPFITLKWAETSEGIIGIRGERLHISPPFTQMICHRRRACHDAILVGRRTWENDKPQLNVRLWAGKDPEKIVLSKETHPLPSLTPQKYTSILVEGGRETLQYFIDNDLWDECYVERNSTPLNSLNSSYVYAPTLRNHVLVEKQHINNFSSISKYEHIN